MIQTTIVVVWLPIFLASAGKWIDRTDLEMKQNLKMLSRSVGVTQNLFVWKPLKNTHFAWQRWGQEWMGKFWFGPPCNIPVSNQRPKKKVSAYKGQDGTAFDLLTVTSQKYLPKVQTCAYWVCHFWMGSTKGQWTLSSLLGIHTKKRLLKMAKTAFVFAILSNCLQNRCYCLKLAKKRSVCK